MFMLLNNKIAIVTGGTRGIGLASVEETFQKVVQEYGRIGKPEEVANAFVFLASEMASYITGVVFSVDGLART